MLKQLHVRHLKEGWQNWYYLLPEWCTWKEATVKWEVLIITKHAALSVKLHIKWSSSLLLSSLPAWEQWGRALWWLSWAGTDGVFFLKNQKNPKQNKSLFKTLIHKAWFLCINLRSSRFQSTIFLSHMTLNSIWGFFGAHQKFLAFTTRPVSLLSPTFFWLYIGNSFSQLPHLLLKCLRESFFPHQPQPNKKNQVRLPEVWRSLTFFPTKLRAHI